MYMSKTNKKIRLVLEQQRLQMLIYLHYRLFHEDPNRGNKYTVVQE